MKKKLVLVVALILVAALSAGVTLALLSDRTGTVNNSLYEPDTDSELIDVVQSTNKTKIAVKNLSGYEVYARVAVIGNEIDDSGNVIGDYDVSSYLNGSGWVEINGFYYYTSKLSEKDKSGDTTGNLVSTPIPLISGTHKYQVTVLSEIIQAEPSSAVQQSWGVTVSNGIITG